MPKGKKIAHATLDPNDINKDVPVDLAAVGDAGLTLDALLEEVKDRLKGKPRDRLASVTREIASHREEWMGKWMPRLTADTAPISPYRVIWDLLHTVDVKNTIITHDAGSPRDQLSPFWVSETPLSYIGWGKTTQLGYGLGLAMGAKLAQPDKLCINVWGDAAIGFTGMDFETAVRERLPILSILLNNFSMAIELKVMPVSTEKYRSTDISGNYADFAKALGGYGERVTEPGQIKEAIKRGIAADPRRQAGAARIHHREGDRRLALSLSARRVHAVASRPSAHAAMPTLDPPRQGDGAYRPSLAIDARDVTYPPKEDTHAIAARHPPGVPGHPGHAGALRCAVDRAVADCRGSRCCGSGARPAPGPRCIHWKKGYVAPPHKHLAGAHAYILSGKLQVRDGILNAGDYVYEPSGVLHDETTALEDTTYLFICNGAVLFFDENGFTRYPNWEVMEKLRTQGAPAPMAAAAE